VQRLPKELALKNMGEFLDRAVSQLPGLGAADVTGDSLFHSGQFLRLLDIVPVESGVLIFAGEDLSLLPGAGLGLHAESP
jgi:hypothetical protein